MAVKSRHPFHTQIRPITTTSVSIYQNNFPSKEFNSYYASSTFSSVSFTISSYLLHATWTPHEIHINRTDKAPFSSNRVLGSVWNTNRETDRSTVCTQWSSWYCLISWSMHEWFGFDVQCCCIDHFLKTSIFSHVWQAAVQILRFLCVEPVVEFDWNLLLSLSSFQLWLFFKQGSSISPSTNKNPNL